MIHPQGEELKMKLKQRVIMMSTLCLTMISLFLIGTTLLSKPQPPKKHDKDNHEPDNLKSDRRAPNPLPSDRYNHPPNHDQQQPLELLNKAVLVQKQLGRFPLSDTTIRINPWRVWERWVTQDSFYPEGAFYSDKMNQILEALATSPVTELGLGYKGTQLKATMMLGAQRTVFKPKRYRRDEVIEGNPYSGFDRHNGEIAGFHLDGILGFRLASPVVGRKINLTALGPVITNKLKATFMQKGDDICFYGECYYCKPAEAACAEGEVMEGSVTLWLPHWYTLKTYRHPYQRTYRRNRMARWEIDKDYCKNVILDQSSEFYPGVLEYTDTAVYDFLMGNADRHHYEVFSEAPSHGKLVHIDNGKTFGNPHHDEMSILAPLEQCCRLRLTTWEKLQTIESSDKKLSEILDQSLRRDPLYPVLSQDHLIAIDRRLEKVMTAIRHCIDREGREVVIRDSWR